MDIQPVQGAGPVDWGGIGVVDSGWMADFGGDVGVDGGLSRSLVERDVLFGTFDTVLDDIGGLEPNTGLGGDLFMRTRSFCATRIACTPGDAGLPASQRLRLRGRVR